jgi:hypothetical protein
VAFDQLATGVRLPFPDDLQIPELVELRIVRPDVVPVDDVEEAAREAVLATIAPGLAAGREVAVGAGSRGMAGRVDLVRGAVGGLRQLGAAPFVVPAMGSHGGATAAGQRAMLASLGIDETSVEAEIRSSMDVVVVGRTPDGMPLYLDEYAASADFIFPVNRIKPHTCFKGPIESGCTKMAVVGFGKQPGAAQIHACGPERMRDRLLAGVAALRDSGRLLGGLASIESAGDDVAEVHALTGGQVGGEREVELSRRALELLPRLPFDEIDVLVVERGGKDISGTTIDPNVTGRFWVNGLADLDRPRVGAIVLLDISDISAGNVLGIGFADFIPAATAAKIDWAKTYINGMTAGAAGLRRTRVPMVLPDHDDCIKAALLMCGRSLDEPKRVVRIRSTKELTTCAVSRAALDDLGDRVTTTSTGFAIATS